MNFEELIATLSKGSATAVTTLESNVAELNALKEYRICGSKTGTGSRHPRTKATYPNCHKGACPAFAARLQTPVEQALRSEIDKNLKTPRVIFVCGSSGDGKSELFRRIHASYAKKVRFHLDATHSFDPQKDAIQTLDDQFSAFKSGNQSLDEMQSTCRRLNPMPRLHRPACPYGPLVPRFVSRCKQNRPFVAYPARPSYPLPPVGVWLL